MREISVDLLSENMGDVFGHASISHFTEKPQMLHKATLATLTRRGSGHLKN